MSHSHRRRSKTYRPRTLAEAISRDPLPQHRQVAEKASSAQVDTTTTAYLQTAGRVPQAAYAFIEDQASYSSYSAAAKDLLFHVTYSQLVLGHDKAPVPYQLIAADTTRTADVWEGIPAIGYLPSREGKVTRRFYILDEYLLPLSEVSVEEEDGWVDIEGKTARESYRKTALCYRDENGKSRPWSRHSDTIHGVLSHFSTTRDLIDLRGAFHYLKEQQQVALKAIREYRRLKQEGASREELRAAFVKKRSEEARYLGDRRILEEIRQQDPRREEGNIFSFVQVIKPEYTGRVSPICSLTGASSGLKAACSVGDNLDIVSSQTELLRLHIQEAEAEGFDRDTAPLLSMPDKDQVAERLGVSRKQVKIVEHSIKFMASLKKRSTESAMKSARFRANKVIKENGIQLEPHQIEEEQVESIALNKLPTIVKAAVQWAEKTGREAQDIYDTLYEVYGPTAQLLEAYADWLLDVWYPRHESYGHVKNACGMRFYMRKGADGYEYKTSVSDWAPISRRKLRAKLSAFRLQGGEAAFIHHLTLLGEEYNYRVLRNEHDGAIVIGDIPEEAIEKARQASGFTTARLEVKSF